MKNSDTYYKNNKFSKFKGSFMYLKNVHHQKVKLWLDSGWVGLTFGLWYFGQWILCYLPVELTPAQ